MNLQSAAPSAAKRHSVQSSVWMPVLALVLALCMLVGQALSSAARAYAANFEGYLWPNQPSSGCCLYFSWAVYPW